MSLNAEAVADGRGEASDALPAGSQACGPMTVTSVP